MASHSISVLMVTASANPAHGGISSAIIERCSYWDYSKCSVVVVSLDKAGCSEDKISSASLICSGSGSKSYGFSIDFYNWIADNIKKFDIVIIDGLWQFHSFVGSYMAKKHNIPYYVIPHGMLGPWFKDKYPMKHLKKLIYWIIIERHVLNNAKKVLYSCRQEKILARNSFPFFYPIEDVSTLGTSEYKGDLVDCKNKFLNKFDIDPKQKTILFLGRIHPVKGIDLLVNAFVASKIFENNYKLIIAGPDDIGLGDAIKNSISDIKLTNSIRFLGMLDYEDKWGALAAANFLCLPSHHENFGVVIAEALSCGTPVIITNKVNIHSIIEEYNVGYVSNDDVNGLLNSLNRVNKMSDFDIDVMSNNAVKCFRENFDISVMMSDLYLNIGV